MFELLYFGEDRSEGDRVQNLLSAHYGDRVKFADASDEIHGYRLEVEIAGETYEDYFAFAQQHDLVHIGLAALLRATFGKDC